MAESGIVFLMYHELELAGRALCQSEPGYVRYILHRDVFQSQIKWLRKSGWHGLCVSEALNYPAGKSVAITFDDGSESDLIAAAPILKENGFNATFYVTAGFLGRQGYLSPEQLRQLRALGFEIGCHSMTHAYLNDLAPQDLRREIVDSGKKIEDILGNKVEHLSCPGGRYDQRALAMAREAGYRSVATSRANANFKETDPFSLGRVAIQRGMDKATFEQVCTGEALQKMRFVESVRGTARTILGNTLYDRFRALMLREGSFKNLRPRWKD